MHCGVHSQAPDPQPSAAAGGHKTKKAQRKKRALPSRQRKALERKARPPPPGSLGAARLHCDTWWTILQASRTKPASSATSSVSASEGETEWKFVNGLRMPVREPSLVCWQRTVLQAVRRALASISNLAWMFSFATEHHGTSHLLPCRWRRKNKLNLVTR